MTNLPDTLDELLLEWGGWLVEWLASRYPRSDDEALETVQHFREAGAGYLLELAEVARVALRYLPHNSDHAAMILSEGINARVGLRGFLLDPPQFYLGGLFLEEDQETVLRDGQQLAQACRLIVALGE